MNETLGQPGEYPEYQTEALTGPQFDEIAFGLLIHDTPVITVNGQRLVNVNGRALDRESDTVTLVCRDEGGRRHVFSYTLDPDSSVSHEIPEDGPDAQA
jgi:hypothetical protein